MNRVDLTSENNTIPSRDQKTYVCIHVFKKERPTLLVTRADGDWCFLCGQEDEDVANSYRVVGLGHLIDADPTLSEILNLEPEQEAERQSVGANWIRTSSRQNS